MSDNLLYLRPDVQVEPLWDCWYAWSHLISPATAARQLTHRHLKIMDSYIAGPQFHAAAMKDPKMIGGPFIDLNGQRVDEIKALRDATKRDRAPLIKLSAALAELDTMLQQQAKGGSLLPLYAAVPDMLKGKVELTYDLNHHPSFRPIEPIFYQSELYDRSAQSLMLSVTARDSRPFVTSTPRLDSKESFRWKLTFDDPRVDRLFALQHQGGTWSQILELLAPSNAEEETLLKTFFTAEVPKPAPVYDGDGVRWRYFGHASMLIESGGVSVMLDPSVSYSYPTDLARYTYEDLPPAIDYVVITHNHQDHVLLETLLRLRSRIKTILVPGSAAGLQDPSLALQLRAIGFRNVVELREFDSVEFAGGSITGLPFFGEHGDLNIQAKMGQAIRFGNHSMLFATDSCAIEPALYRHIKQATGPVDSLFIGMECDGAPMSWIYGPYMSKPIDRALDQQRRLNGSHAEQGMAIARELGCSSLYVYAMGQEPWLGHVMGLKYTAESRPLIESDKLLAECASIGIHAERLYGMREVVM
ncbi:MAG: MBL fold metallo-hydrolase [Comamonadaceae bacterium]|nr:MAG: MBL fold metallo-hydrolase [Comamonadaceae bacterium]